MIRDLTRDRGYRDAFAGALPTDPRVTRNHHHIAATVALRARQDGTRAVISHEALMHATRLKKTTVKDVLRDLREWGWLLVERRGHHTRKGEAVATMYTLCIPVVDTVDNHTQGSARNDPSLVDTRGSSTGSADQAESQGSTQSDPWDGTQGSRQTGLWPRPVENPTQGSVQTGCWDGSQGPKAESQGSLQSDPSLKDLSPITPSVVNQGGYLTCGGKTLDAPAAAVGAAS